MPRSPLALTCGVMSSTGAANGVPSRITLITPLRSTTNSRLASPGGDVTYIGELKLPTGTSAGAAAAPAGAASASSASASSALVIRDIPVLGLEREALRVPGLEASGHRVRVPSGAPERAGRHPRAGADAPVEDHGPVAVDRLGLRVEVRELDVAPVGDPPRLVLVALPDVDELDLAACVGVTDHLGGDVELVRAKGIGHRTRHGSDELRSRTPCLGPGASLMPDEPVRLARPRAQQR